MPDGQRDRDALAAAFELAAAAAANAAALRECVGIHTSLPTSIAREGVAAYRATALSIADAARNLQAASALEPAVPRGRGLPVPGLAACQCTSCTAVACGYHLAVVPDARADAAWRNPVPDARADVVRGEPVPEFFEVNDARVLQARAAAAAVVADVNVDPPDADQPNAVPNAAPSCAFRPTVETRPQSVPERRSTDFSERRASCGHRSPVAARAKSVPNAVPNAAPVRAACPTVDAYTRSIPERRSADISERRESRGRRSPRVASAHRLVAACSSTGCRIPGGSASRACVACNGRPRDSPRAALPTSPQAAKVAVAASDRQCAFFRIHSLESRCEGSSEVCLRSASAASDRQLADAVASAPTDAAAPTATP